MAAPQRARSALGSAMAPDPELRPAPRGTTRPLLRLRRSTARLKHLELIFGVTLTGASFACCALTADERVGDSKSDSNDTAQRLAWAYRHCHPWQGCGYPPGSCPELMTRKRSPSWACQRAATPLHSAGLVRTAHRGDEPAQAERLNEFRRSGASPSLSLEQLSIPVD